MTDESAGWEAEAWKSHGGYGNRNEDNDNNDRERIWFSPYCLHAATDTLFAP